MKKIYILLSTILYLFFIGILYKNFTETNKTYYFDKEQINTLTIIFLLIVKIAIDLLLFFKKNEKTKKLSYIYFFAVFILFLKFIPDANQERKLLSKNLKAMLTLNDIVFSKFDLKNNKLPSDAFFKSLERINLGKSVYLKKGGRKYHYIVKVLYADNPKLSSENEAPGTFFVTISKKNKDFYITATILDPQSGKTVMLGIDGETVILNKNINKEEIIRKKKQLEIIRYIYLNLKYNKNFTYGSKDKNH